MENRLTYQKAETKKRVFSVFIDYFLLTIGTVIFYFLLVMQVANTLPISKNISENFYTNYSHINTILEESHLDSINPESYLKMAIKSSLGEDYYPTSEYNLIADLNMETDPIHYYLSTFKEEEKDNYEDFSFDVDTYIKDLINSSYFLSQETYIKLDENVAKRVGDYLFYGNQNMKEDYNALFSFINEEFNKARSDLAENNTSYKNSLDKLNQASNDALTMNFVNLNISLLLSYILIILLPILVSKKHKSLGNIVMKISPIYNEKGRKTRLFVKLIFSFAASYSSIFLASLLTSGRSFGQLLMLNLFNINFVLILFIFGVLLTIFSFILEFLKISEGSLSDYFAGIRYTDDMKAEVNYENGN